MTRLSLARLLFAVLCLTAVSACDTSGTDVEPPPEEELPPIVLEYYADVPAGAFDYTVTYTDADGEQTPVQLSDRPSFPVIITLDGDSALPGDASGEFVIRFEGRLPEGAALVRVTSNQDGLIRSDQADAPAQGLDTVVRAEASITLGG